MRGERTEEPLQFFLGQRPPCQDGVAQCGAGERNDFPMSLAPAVEATLQPRSREAMVATPAKNFKKSATFDHAMMAI